MSEARDILTRLVALKDGPRDETYRAAKESAWADARALLALEVCGNCGAARRPDEQHVAMTLGMCSVVNADDPGAEAPGPSRTPYSRTEEAPALTSGNTFTLPDEAECTHEPRKSDRDCPAHGPFRCPGASS